MNETSKSKHILDLVKDLLEDIELDRSSGDKLILKASRLARIVDAEEIKEWLRFELSGFKRDNDTSIKYMGITGRWIKRDDNKGYWITLAAIEAIIETENFKLKIMQNPNLSGGLIVREINKISKDIVKLTQIKGKIMSCLHTFVTDVYYEKMFDHLSESIFESYKSEVDNLIYRNCSDLLKQIPSVVDRLASEESESFNQSLGTCRRIIESFADSIFPASEKTIKIEGNELKLDASKHQNRINAYIHENCIT